MFMEYRLIEINKLVNTGYSGIYIVPGTPFIYFEDIKALVFADTHLGYEEALARGYMYVSGKKRDYVKYMGGVIVPRRQYKKLIEYLDIAFRLLSDRIERVIIDGDLKHAFDRLLRLERIEVDKLLKYLREKDVEEIIIIRGNHDNYLPLVLKKYGLELVKYYEAYVEGIGKVLFTHGHLDIDIKGYDLVVIGHEHPSIRCFSYYKPPVFLLVETSIGNNILVLPASGAYQSGTVISFNREEYLSPIIRRYSVLDNAKIITWITQEEVVIDDKSIGDELLSDIVSITTFTINNKSIIYLGFNSLEDILFVCGL